VEPKPTTTNTTAPNTAATNTTRTAGTAKTHRRRWYNDHTHPISIALTGPLALTGTIALTGTGTNSRAVRVS